MKNLKTRIIAGIYKGKSLFLPPLETTRSSKSILKESFFNVIQYDIIDTIFVEAFGGSGSIGLEALSRGAYHTYFCEKDKKSFRILQKNCEIIDSSKCTSILGNTFDLLPNIINNNIKSTNKQVVVYIDPPFDFRDGMENIYEQSFDMVKQFENENIFMIVFEHKSDLEMPQDIGQYTQYKTKKFGNSSLTYYN